MASLETINLHLIGKQGSGKSATGNSIAERKVFTFRRNAHCSPVLSSSEIRNGSLGNRTVQLWDWPGIDGTQVKTQVIAEEMRKIAPNVAHNNHLLLWVIRYGELCDQQDEELMKILTTELGEDMIIYRTIVVVTGRDNFEIDVEGMQLTFVEWVQKQLGFFERLCKMCHGRILAFDNRGKRRDQPSNLFHMVSEVLANMPKKCSPKHSSRAMSGHLVYPALENTELMEFGEMKDPAESLTSYVDEFCNILTGTTLSNTRLSLTMLLSKVCSLKIKGGKERKGALEREIERKIEQLDAIINLDKSTCTYLGKLRRKFEQESDAERAFVDLGLEVDLGTHKGQKQTPTLL